MLTFSLFDLAFLAEKFPGSYDDIESYTNGAFLNLLNAGTGWTNTYIDSTNYFGAQSYDSIESYTNGAALNGLNGGDDGWTSAYVDR